MSLCDVVHAVSHHGSLRVRFCDDSDRIGHRVQFGFVTRKCCRMSFGLQFTHIISHCLLPTDANDGSGIRIASLYGIDIYLEALA